MFEAQQKLHPNVFFIFPVRGFYVKITHNRESMKPIARFLLVALSLVSADTALAVVPSTRGNNLTAYNGNSGAVNNNTWNTLMNSRAATSGDAASADFGNCNAIVLRCAQPKCASGGCTDMTVATSIVDGCVRSNEACQQYGSDLVSYIAAQLVANSTAKVNAQNAAAQTAAANAVAQQNAQQLQAMQAQMQQMQQTMAQQNAETVAQLQSALAQQQEQLAAAQSAAQPAASSASDDADAAPDNGLTAAQNAAAAAGVSADTLAREQITGQIYEKIENSETQMKTLKSTMQDAFTYAGCDASGNNCTGPHRVKAFKQRAMNFFEPYNAVLDEVYDALILAQSVGVDISDIYMMLNGTCNAWAQYMCSEGQVMHYTTQNCQNGKSVTTDGACFTFDKKANTQKSCSTGLIGGHSCRVGQVVPMSDGGCQLVKMLTSTEDVRREWLNIAEGDEHNSIRVGCASEALDNSTLFRNRKKQATIDIETLERIIEQDAPAAFTGDKTPENNGVIFCQVGDKLQDLQKNATLKTIPAKMCAKLDATGTSLSADANATTCDYILPQYAMCTTHVYNIGKTENSSVAAERQEMKDVIALKTTIMTQQIKAQYDYLDATMRRLKTQLEKAILTTKLQAAGAGTTSDGGTSTSGNTGDKNIYLAGTQNCNNMNTTAEVFTCLRSNYNLIYNMSNGGTNITTELRKQLANDVGVVVSNAGGAGLMPNNVTESNAGNSNATKKVLSGLPDVAVDDKTVDCSVARQIQGRNAFQKCLSQLNIEIRNATSNLNSRQQQQNQNTPRQ